MAKIIAITGNSGKTMLSYFLGNTLAVGGKKAVIIATDNHNPIYQLLLERGKNSPDKSLGRVLSAAVVDAKVTLDNMIPFKNNKNLGVISYAPGENENTYPQLVERDIEGMMDCLSNVADYIIIDTQTNQNVIDKHILVKADVTLCITSADLKGIAHRQIPLLDEPVNVLLCNRKDCPLEDVLKTFESQVKYILAYDMNISAAFCGKTLEDICAGKKYLSSLSKIIKEVIDIEQHN